ncbi:MAG: PaaI family thioesterase [Solirubrobacteraceae bacterium]
MSWRAEVEQAAASLVSSRAQRLAGVIVPMVLAADVFQDPIGFDRLYGLQIVTLEPALARGELVIGDQHLQPFGHVHGGVYCAIAEGLCSYATAAVVTARGMFAVGMSNHTSFLRPATHGTLHATATRKHAGRTTWIWEVEITDDEARICALTRMTVAVRDLPASAD